MTQMRWIAEEHREPDSVVHARKPVAGATVAVRNRLLCNPSRH
jgi:hypothetical protein